MKKILPALFLLSLLPLLSSILFLTLLDLLVIFPLFAALIFLKNHNARKIPIYLLLQFLVFRMLPCSLNQIIVSMPHIYFLFFIGWLIVGFFCSLAIIQTHKLHLIEDIIVPERKTILLTLLFSVFTLFFLILYQQPWYLTVFPAVGYVIYLFYRFVLEYPRHIYYSCTLVGTALFLKVVIGAILVSYIPGSRMAVPLNVLNPPAIQQEIDFHFRTHNYERSAKLLCWYYNAFKVDLPFGPVLSRLFTLEYLAEINPSHSRRLSRPQAYVTLFRESSFTSNEAIFLREKFAETKGLPWQLRSFLARQHSDFAAADSLILRRFSRLLDTKGFVFFERRSVFSNVKDAEFTFFCQPGKYYFTAHNRDQRPVTVRLDGRSVTLDPSGESKTCYSETLQLTKGEHTVRVMDDVPLTLILLPSVRRP